jgi:hypothetical protein
MATCRKITVTLPESLITALDRPDVRRVKGPAIELDRSQLLALAAAELLARYGFAGPVRMEQCDVAVGDEASP